MSCRQLAMAGRYVMDGGRSDGHSVISPRRARRINALMMSCGHYDNSGDFAYRTGLPGKSGVGGGIRSEEHTSELQSLMRISYAVFCLKKKNNRISIITTYNLRNNINEVDIHITQSKMILGHCT